MSVVTSQGSPPGPARTAQSSPGPTAMRGSAAVFPRSQQMYSNSLMIVHGSTQRQFLRGQTFLSTGLGLEEKKDCSERSDPAVQCQLNLGNSAGFPQESAGPPDLAAKVL